MYLLISFTYPYPLWLLVCSLWVGFCFVTFFHLFYFLNSTYKWKHTVFIFFCLFLFNWPQYPPDPSMLLQLAKFHSFLWFNNSPVYACSYTHTHTHTHTLVSIEAYLGDSIHLVPDHQNKANITVKQVTHIVLFPSAYISFGYIIL